MIILLSRDLVRIGKSGQFAVLLWGSHSYPILNTHIHSRVNFIKGQVPSVCLERKRKVGRTQEEHTNSVRFDYRGPQHCMAAVLTTEPLVFLKTEQW